MRIERACLLAICVLVATASVCQADPAAPGAPAAAAAEQAKKLINQLPRVDQLDDTVHSYYYRMGWDELKPLLAKTATLAVVEEPGVQAFLKEVRRMGQRGDKVGPAFAFMLDSCMQELVLFGKGDVKNAGGDGPPAPAFGPSIYGLTVRPSGARQVEFAAMRQAGLKSLTETGLMPTVAAGKNIQIGTVLFNKLGEDENVLLTAWDGKTMLVSGSEAGAKWCASLAPLGEGAKSLAASSRFGSTVGPLMTGQSNAPFALYYEDLARTWAAKKIPATSRLSWRSIDSLAGASFVEDAGFRNRHYLKLGDKRVGLFAHTKGGSVNAEWLKRIPADASAFATGYWNPASFILSAAWFGPALFRQDSSDVFNAMEGEDGPLTMLDPLFQTIGPRFMYYRVARKYGGFPGADVLPMTDMVLVMELKDGAGFAKQLDKLLASAGGGFLPVGPGRAEYKSHSIRQLNVFFFSMYWVVVKDAAIMAFHPQLLKDALDQWDAPGESIVDTPAYKAASVKLLKDPCFIFYIAPGGFVRGIYDRYIPVLQQAAGMFPFAFGDGENRHVEVPAEKRGFNPLLLPRGGEIARHVTEATILSAHDDGQGVLFDGYAPLLSVPYYLVGFQATFKTFNFPATSLMSLMGYVMSPAHTEGGGNARNQTQPADEPNE